MGVSLKRRQKKLSVQSKDSGVLSKLNLNTPGIDIGAEEHYVAVPEDRDKHPVRTFRCFTSDLHAMAQWLKECRIDSVAMESTGVYWIPVFQPKNGS